MTERRTVSFQEHAYVFIGQASDPYFETLGHSPKESLLKRLAARLPREAVVFDIGASIGATTAIFASLVDRGLIYSVEASPLAFPWLAENIRLNGLARCTPICCAAGARAGRADFFENRDATSTSHLVTTETIGGSNSTVEVKTIDQLRVEHKIGRLDFMKIDVGGFEVDVLLGADKTLADLRPTVLVSFNTFTMIAYRNVTPRSILYKLISTFPFLYYVLGPDQFVTITDDASIGTFLHDNIVRRGGVDTLICSWEPMTSVD